MKTGKMDLKYDRCAGKDRRLRGIASDFLLARDSDERGVIGKPSAETKSPVK